METIKDVLNFCNSAIFYDYKNVGIFCEMHQARGCIFNIFYKTIPDSRTRVSLSITDDIVLKVHDNDIENIIEKILDLRENALNMISFEKLIRDEQQTIKPFLIDDDNQE